MQRGRRLAQAGLKNSADGRWAVVNVLNYESTALPGSGIHVIGDASGCGMPKAGHAANLETKLCADAIVRLFLNGQPDPHLVAYSACFASITASTTSWLSAVHQYDSTDRKMKLASNGCKTLVNGLPATATKAASIDGDNFEDMATWFKTLMQDTAG